MRFDVATIMKDDPDLIKEFFTTVDHFAFDYLRKSSSLQCQPVHRFPMSNFEGAFKQIDKAPYHGLVTMTADRDTLVPVATETQIKPLADAIDSKGTYVLAGGLGGLGRSIAKLLADNGAKKLVFLSRSGGNQDAQDFLHHLSKSGVQATAAAVDITDLQALRALAPTLGKIAGVVQCAAVIQVSLLTSFAPYLAID